MKSKFKIKNICSKKAGGKFFLLSFFLWVFISCNKETPFQKIEDFYTSTIGFKSNLVIVNAYAEIVKDSYLVYPTQNFKFLQYFNFFDSSIHNILKVHKTSANFSNIFFSHDTLCLLSYNQEIYKFLDTNFLNKTTLPNQFENEKNLTWGMFNNIIKPIADKNRYYAYPYFSGNVKEVAQKLQNKIKEGSIFCIDGRSSKILFRMGGKREGKDNIYYRFSNQAQFVQSGNEFGVVLHILDNFATVWNRHTGVFIKRVELPFLNNYTQKDAYDSMNTSANYEKIFDLTHPCVELFYYDTYQKLYYILQSPQIPLKIVIDEVEDPYLTFRHPFKLFVLNSDFELKHTFKLDPSIYVLNHLLCTSKGLMIGKLKDKNDLSPCQKELNYDIFKF